MSIVQIQQPPALTAPKMAIAPAPSLPPPTMPIQERSFSSPTITQPHYRRCGDSMAEDVLGHVQIFNGIDKPLRFATDIGTTETVGVIAPASALTLGGNGLTGPIVGTFYSYVRFVDRYGNFSSLSPLSNVFTPSTSVGTITNATNASPIVVTTAAPHGLSTNQIVKIQGVYGNANANGIYTARVIDASNFSLYIGDVASFGSGPYNSGGTVTTGVSQIQYTNVPTPTEAKVVRRQILRNQDGSTAVFYVDIDTTDLTSTSFNSSTTSSSLGANPSVSLFDSNGETLVDKSLPLNSKKLLAACLGRLFTAGNEPYTQGAVKVTNGSAVVTGIGTEWGQLTFASRFLQVVGGDKTYTIQSCDSATQVTLTAPYTGTTDQYAYYQITNGDGERRTIYWTAPQQPEAWPVTNSLTLSEDPGAGDITALMPLRSWLYIFAEYRTYRFSYVSDPLFDGYSVTATKRGCVNQRTWVTLDDTAYVMDYVGFYAYSGNNFQEISTPAVQDLFRSRQSSTYRINWAAKRNFHCVYDPGDATIRWFICLSGSYAPFHACCYSLRTKHWWLEEYPFPIGASCLGRLSGKPQVFLGTDARRIFALHQSTLDGVDPASGTVRSTVTSAGVNWLADTTASFGSVAGEYVTIVNGTGKGQRRRIVSVSGTTLNVDQPWVYSLDTTSKYQIGGVTWNWKSGWLRFQDNAYTSERSVAVHFKPTASQAEMHLRMYLDLAATPKSDWAVTHTLAEGNGIALLKNDPTTDLSIDTTKANGHVIQRFPTQKEPRSAGTRYMAVELGGTSNADALPIFQVELSEVVQ